MMNQVLDIVSSSWFVIGLAIVLLLFFIILIVQMMKVRRLKRRLDQFVMGSNGSSLEKDIASLYEDNQSIKIKTNDNRLAIQKLDKEFDHAYQKLGIVKYDAFRQVGGQLSFSLALLNRQNDGFVINSVHSTDGCYTYTKEIKGGKCAFTLGEEETKALETAMTQ
jgi:biopolymer transport protein ExbB/TolQ